MAQLKKRLLFACLLLLALAMAAHAPALRAGFVWDDTALILRDPLIRSWRLIPEQFQHFLFTDATPSNFYRPVQRITYTFEYWAVVFHPALFHFTNILLHAGAAMALLAFALGFLELYGIAEKKRLYLGTLAAVAWVVHPLHSAAVDYVSGRADSLAALFGFIGLFFCSRALRLDVAAAWKFHVLSGLAFLLSALSKESGLLFPVIALALVLLHGNGRALRDVAVAVAFVATIYGTLRAQADVVQVPQLSAPAPLLVRPIIAARTVAEYAGLLVAPVRLHMDRDVESRPWGMDEKSMTATAWRELQTVAGIALVGLLGWWMVRARRREPAVFASLLFAAISYVPVSGLVPLNANVAEHWLYVPSAFLMLAVGLQIAQLREPQIVRAATICVCGWIAVIGVRSFVHAGDWHDERTFLQRNIAAGGGSARMLVNLGVLDMGEHKLDVAAELFRRALGQEPNQPFALLDLGAVALKKNDWSAARKYLLAASAQAATKAQAHEMMAVLSYKETGAVDLLRLRLASRVSPSSWSIESRYARTLWEAGHTGAAIAELRSVLRSEPYRAESWQLLAVYLARTGHVQDAVLALSQASDLDVHIAQHAPL